MDICKEIAGAEAEMDERTIALMGRLSEVLDLGEKKAPAKKPARAKTEQITP
jgi:hypothetical protein